MKYIDKTRFFILTVMLTLLFSFSISYAKNTNNNLSGALVRLHILANSNSEEDQALKIAVRDRIIRESGNIFENSQSPDDALACATKNIELISAIAKDEISDRGYDYDVNVKIGRFPFPTKTYNDIMLPAGKYNAVRIEIGSGKGENWWCVMYPPLCFTDTAISISQESRQKLKESLSPDDYSLITNQSHGSIPVEVRFKIVELFQELIN